MKHNILLTYCHEIVGVAMKWLVQQHFPLSAIGEAQNFQTALDDLPKRQYDLVVLDTEIGDSAHVLGTVRHIKTISPKTSILVLSELDEVVYGPKYLASGINGFLAKKADITSIILAIKTALKGDVFLGTQKDILTLTEDQVYTDNPFYAMSKRESQIVESLITGASLTEIGRKMNLKETTVSTYKKRIFEKAGVKTLSDLIAIWKIYR